MRLFHRLASIGLAVAAWLPVAAASEPPDRKHLRVGIAIDVPGSEAAGYPALMIAEADAIWRQHGVSIARMSRDIKPVDVRLTVTFKSRSGVATVWRTGRIAIGGEGRL